MQLTEGTITNVQTKIIELNVRMRYLRHSIDAVGIKVDENCAKLDNDEATDREQIVTETRNMQFQSDKWIKELEEIKLLKTFYEDELEQEQEEPKHG